MKIDKKTIYIRKRDKVRCAVTKTGKTVVYVTFPLLHEVKTQKEVFLTSHRLPKDGELSMAEELDIREHMERWVKPTRAEVAALKKQTISPLSHIFDVGRDFSQYPAGRYKSDGPQSGELLRAMLVDHLRRYEGVPVEVHMDGAVGYPSSFLEEAFGGLVRVEGFKEDIYARLKIITAKPQLADQVGAYIAQALVRMCLERNIGIGGEYQRTLETFRQCASYSGLTVLTRSDGTHTVGAMLFVQCDAQLKQMWLGQIATDIRPDLELILKLADFVRQLQGLGWTAIDRNGESLKDEATVGGGT